MELSDAQLKELARLVARELEPVMRLRVKKQFRSGLAAELYDVSEDYLRRQPIDLLPRIQEPRLTIYRGDHLDQFFEGKLLHG